MRPVTTTGERGRSFDPAAVAPEGFEQFYRSERRRAVQLAWLLVHDTHAAEDIAQEAFFAVHDRYNDLDNPGAYLRRCITNRSHDRHRQLDRERRRNQLVIAGQPANVEGPSGGVLDAIAKLPTRQREATILRYWAGLSDRDIAEVIGVRVGTVRSALSRATTRLRKELLP